jgi:hypothetical protein
MFDDELPKGLPDAMAPTFLRNFVILVVGQVVFVLDLGVRA